MASYALVTGAGGYIGGRVAQYLARTGYIVAGIGHAGAGALPQGIAEWVPGAVDVANLARLRQVPGLVVHCAGGSSVARSLVDPAGEEQRTLGAARAVLEYAERFAPQASLVLVSSAAVYGDVRIQPIAETQAPAPVSPYGRHKLEAEALWAAQAAQGTRAAIVRFFSVYGEGLRKQLLWDACRKLSDGNVHFSGTGEERRDWLHVDDAARLLAVAGEHAGADCPTVNGAAGTAVAVREILGELAVALRRPADIRFDGAVRAGDPPGYWADISKARQWEWAPSVDWRDGVRRYANWYRTACE